MKTPKIHRRLLLRSPRLLSIGSVCILAALILGSGFAEGGLPGQTTGGQDKDKKKEETPPSAPTIVTSGGGGSGDSKGVTTGSPGQGAGTNPAAIQAAIAGAGAQTAPGTTAPGGVVVVQSPNNGQQSTTPGPQAKLAPVSEVAKILSKHVFSSPKGLPFFGYNFFESARTGIEQRIKTIGDINPNPRVGDPTTGPIGPQMQYDALVQPSPERYQLGPGDTISMRVSSPTETPAVQDLVVDNLGSVTIPQTGEKIVVRGQTLAQLEHTIKVAVRQGLKDADVSLQMKELRTMPIYILGQSYAPGTYQMPAVMSLFNAIYMSGGPNENGSLRRIKVTRTNGFVKEFDLYKLLVSGDRTQDMPLQPGDVINILHVGDRIAFDGDVTQPAIYELKPGEKLQDLMRWASGIKPSGVSQNISIEKTNLGTERILVDANGAINDKANNPVLHDGDNVNVYSIRPELVNEVTVEGAVDQPHHYGLTKGMTVADLVDAARGLMPDAYPDRADLFRRNDDLVTHTLIRIDLKKALRRDAYANVKLKEDDRVVIYRVSDVQWMGERQVIVQGAVNKAGTFYRADNLAVRDVLLQAGGLGPEAYDSLAFLQRTNIDGTVGPLFKVNLIKAMRGDATDNIVFEDRDVLKVFTTREANFIADQTVTIKGAVQHGAVFPLSPHMTVRDVLLLAGNILPTAYVQTAFIQRTNLDGTPGPLLKFDLLKALAGNVANNPELQSRDVVTVYTEAEATFIPDLSVSIKGAVQKPASFPLAPHMTARDVILLAGNILPTAHVQHAFIQRTNLDGTPGPLLTFDIQKALEGDQANNPELASRDAILVYTLEQEDYRPKQVVDIVGAVQTPSQYVLSQGMKVHDLLILSGKPIPTAFTERAFLQRTNLDGTVGELKLVDLNKALSLDPANDLLLQPGDKLNVYTKDQTQARPLQTVLISGAVQKPASYPRAENMTLQDLLRLAGGPTPKASDRLELAKSRVPEGTPVQRFALQDMMGPSGAGVKLEDGDIVAVPEDGRILDQPMKITVSGEVMNPGPYLVTSKTEHLSSLIKRAGGIMPDAYARGAQFIRQTADLSTEAQRQIGPRILEVLTKVQADEFKRALARSEVEKLRALSEAQKLGTPAVTLSSSGQVAPTSGAAIPGQNGLTNQAATTEARKLGDSDLLPSGNINVNVSAAIRHPGGPEDIILRDGDQIIIPQTPISVNVTGAVLTPYAVRFEKGMSMIAYINRAGGFTADAAKDAIIVIRSSGTLMKASLNTKLEVGDTIFIPTKVEADHLHDKGADFTNNLAQLTNAGLLVAVVHALIK